MKTHETLPAEKRDAQQAQPSHSVTQPLKERATESFQIKQKISTERAEMARQAKIHT